jgi:hypothetical protein
MLDGDGGSVITVLALLLVLVSAWAGVRGARLLVRGAGAADEEASSLRVVRGLRGVVVAVGLGALATGLVFAQTWLLAFGVVFLAEELYETGVLVLILRRGQRLSAGASREAA